MGLLDALTKSSSRFESEKIFKELEVGFDYRPINWVIDLDPNSDKLTIKGRYKDEMIRSVPLRADRSGKVSKNNIKPNLFVDNALYSLGLGDGPTTEVAFAAFKKLHEDALISLQTMTKVTDQKEAEKELKILLEFLNLPKHERMKRLKEAKQEVPEEKENQNNNKTRRKKDSKTNEPKSSDLVAFVITKRYSFDEEYGFARTFWKKHLQNDCSDQVGFCSICGKAKPLCRILPFKLRLFGERCPILSVNTDEQQSFGSLGKDQLGNSPICMECAGNADRLLKFLIQSGRHSIVLSSRNEKQSLGKQIAVFWTKEHVKSTKLEKIEFEDLIKVPIEEFDSIEEDVLPVKAAQCRALLESPFVGNKDIAGVQTNQFYLAVLSPNKSRLVVREWLEEKIDKIQENIKHYMDALQIIHPDGRGILGPPLPAMLEALQSYTSVKQKYKEVPRIPATGPDAVRKLLRCIYTGTPPPEALLTRALQCFRIPDLPIDSKEHERQNRQMYRRMAMAAAMKLILTYNKNKKEQQAMEQLKTEFDSESEYKKKSPYNCGVLLAVLEAIQRRASSSGHGVNTTLVDRFYGAASTAPATIFANLINMATKAHLPKLRRENKELFKVRYQEESVNINDLMTDACKAIDDAGGFPPPLKPDEQAAFALGFYHQRAAWAPQKKVNHTTKTNIQGDLS